MTTRRTAADLARAMAAGRRMAVGECMCDVSGILFVISEFGLCGFSCFSQDRLVRIAITTGLNVITFPIRSGPKQKDVIVDENG